MRAILIDPLARCRTEINVNNFAHMKQAMGCDLAYPQMLEWNERPKGLRIEIWYDDEGRFKENQGGTQVLHCPKMMPATYAGALCVIASKPHPEDGWVLTDLPEVITIDLVEKRTFFIGTLPMLP